MNRRDFIFGACACGVAGGVCGGLGVAKRLLAGGEGDDGMSAAVMPPGAKSFLDFTASCSACGLCAAACPSKVIKVTAATDAGLFGILMPRLDFSAGHCQTNCGKCSSVCPADALNHEWVRVHIGHIRIGVAVWQAKNCIVTCEGTSCGLCAERCPHEAITMEKSGSEDTPHPVVKKEACVGCGACEHYCPAQPKAIVVHGFAEQKTT